MSGCRSRVLEPTARSAEALAFVDGTERKPTEIMRQFADDNGLAFHGLHHEIYLSDPRRVPPERLRTVLRMPVRAVGT